jgi:lipopolysaccharide transport system ATP-binding protein
MSDIIIRAENVGKRYVLNHQNKPGGYTKLSDTLLHTAKAPLRWLKTANRQQQTENTKEDFWALKDVSFEIKRGDVVGIIGRNGAGKSTLLKVLSRITEPTTGRITLNGRVASLLEVGTGFHPELTGRENIFLNGAILGMSKAEIKAKFDEIVAFAEIEKFLDTPVKRYSSGMYVRLAFAVAAHLEPEILIIDEVLAVGDSEFQKKCLGKMKDVAGQGRTVLFVSHNMAAVTALCSRAIVMHRGSPVFDGLPDDAIIHYIDTTKPIEKKSIASCRLRLPNSDEHVTRITEINSRNANGKFQYGETLAFELTVQGAAKRSDLSIGASVMTTSGNALATLFTPEKFNIDTDQTVRLLVQVDPSGLVPGHYTMGFSVGSGSQSSQRKEDDVIIGMPEIEILPTGSASPIVHWSSYWGQFCWSSRSSLTIDPV